MPVPDPIEVPATPLTRNPTTVLPLSEETPSFAIKASDAKYAQQYAQIYYARLELLRSHVEERAKKRWRETAGNPKFVQRALDVERGQICYIIGTVYMDMPLKPNVLEDLARDHSIPAPPPREKIYSPDDIVTLEDRSGRICLVGDRVRSAQLVTGVIIAALGMEISSGDFEVVDICFAGMAPQPHRSVATTDEQMDVDEDDEWVALVSGLEVGAPSPSDAQIQLLAEYLTGEAGGPSDQASSARISRLIVAGNSFAPIVSINAMNASETDRKSKRYGQEPANFSTHPGHTLSKHLHDISRAMPIHLLPGASDPAGTIIPQQPFPRAMFGGAAGYASFTTETNPTYIHLGLGPTPPPPPPAPSSAKGKQKASSSAAAAGASRTLLVTSGQNIDDMYKYVPTPPATRLGLAAATLRWRHVAPTAPDTLWCHPFRGMDPFVIRETPDIYVVGNQPAFGTRLLREEDEEGEKRCRIVLVPGFRETGTLVLVSLRTLKVRVVQFAVEGMSAGGGES